MLLLLLFVKNGNSLPLVIFLRRPHTFFLNLFLFRVFKIDFRFYYSCCRFSLGFWLTFRFFGGVFFCRVLFQTTLVLLFGGSFGGGGLPLELV